jgi:hypothetical protein
VKIRVPELVPDPTEPFKDDLLERRPLAERFTRFLANVEGPFTMALSGSYGSGKTFFVCRCKVLLEQQSVPTVIINAWETDFAAEPLAPIITELGDKFSARLKPAEKGLKNAKALVAKVTAASVPTALKIAIDMVPGAGAVADAVEKLAEKQFEQFAAAKKSVSQLKKELARITEQIRYAQTSKSDTDESSFRPPIVVLIDELDRCRPSYAIEVLEVLKHFFDNPGIVFVLAIDREQLISAAKAVFGSGLDGDGYLRRFIDFECQLPTPNIRNFAHRMLESTSSIVDWRRESGLVSNAIRLCEASGFSLRKTQQFLLRCGVAIAAASTMASPHDALFLAFVREIDRELYRGFVRGTITSWQLLTKLRELDPELGYPSGDGIPFVHILAAVGQDDSPKPFIDTLREDYEKNNVKFTNFDWITRNLSGYSRAYLRRVAEAVDFGATFVG